MTVNIEERKSWDLRPGNTIRVWQKIKEGEKTRLQVFEGLVIAHKHGMESGATFTVRKISKGVGVERIFPVFSPNIEKIEIVKKSKVRRSKLYYIRDKSAKQIRKKMKQIKFEARKDVEEKIATSVEAVADKKKESKNDESEKVEDIGVGTKKEPKKDEELKEKTELEQ